MSIHMGKSCKLYLVWHFRRIFNANLKRGHDYTHSTGKDLILLERIK